ncbi:hypothetical protein BH11MYX4_BH11MYX4_37900 [soil metagenome]
MAALVSPTSLVRGPAPAPVPGVKKRRGIGPRDWPGQLRDSVRTVADLARSLALTPEELEGARRAELEGLPLAITPY